MRPGWELATSVRVCQNFAYSIKKLDKASIPVWIIRSFAILFLPNTIWSTMEMQKKLDSICKIIVEKQASREDARHKPDFKTNILFPFLTFLVHKTRRFHFEKNFFADSKCSGCGICEKGCLAEKIRLENGRPVWCQRYSLPILFRLH